MHTTRNEVPTEPRSKPPRTDELDSSKMHPHRKEIHAPPERAGPTAERVQSNGP